MSIDSGAMTGAQLALTINGLVSKSRLKTWHICTPYLMICNVNVNVVIASAVLALTING